MSEEQYNLVVIGAGAAGLTASAFGGELGAKVALIEKHKLGGDCTWVGCVPSKALLKVAKVAHHMRTADEYGLTSAEPEVDMVKVRDRIKHIIEDVYAGETPEVFTNRGVEVIEGMAEFIDEHTVVVNGRQLKSKKFVIATGGTALIPPVNGLNEVPYFTNNNFFDNDRLPEHLIIMGAGAIGLEMAQAYRRLGAQVTVIGAQVMPRDDEDAVKLIKGILEGEGVRIVEDFVTEVSNPEGNTIIATTKSGEEIQGDMLLVAVGRKPVTEGIGLDKAGVKYDKTGIHIDKFLRTNKQHIYAVGDCTPSPRLTHYAGFQGSVAGSNALFPLVNRVGQTDVFPWVTFTDPEVAQVGLTEKAAREKHGDAAKVFMFSLDDGDRTIAEGDTKGFIKIVYRGSGDLLGATVVSERAGEMIQEFTNAMASGGLRGMVGTIHAYPTYSDVVKKAGSKLMIQELFEGTSGRVINVASRVLWR